MAVVEEKRGPVPVSQVQTDTVPEYLAFAKTIALVGAGICFWGAWNNGGDKIAKGLYSLLSTPVTR